MESVPSAFIITVILRSAGENVNRRYQLDILHICLLTVGPGNIRLENLLFNPDSPSLFTRIFGLSSFGISEVAYVEFATTYAISIISAALGLAKCLKNGVARPIAPGGEQWTPVSPTDGGTVGSSSPYPATS